MATEKWDEVELDLDPKTVADEAERQVADIQAAQDLKAEVSKASKTIHAFGGEEYVWQELTKGITTTAVCKMMGVSPGAFYRWVERGGEARQQSYARAKAAAAHALVEDSLAIADETQYAESNVQVASAKLRTDVRWRIAQAWNKEAYGQQQAEININLGDIALSALRKRTVRDVTDVDPTDD